jgi:small subunit ribosomal protein S9
MSTATNVFLGTGRRKTSTARVRITEGSGKLTVNGRTFDAYFSHENFAKQAYAPLLTVELREKIDVTVATFPAAALPAKPVRLPMASPAPCRR